MQDVLAAGSFFHYAEGFTAPRSFDLTLPEVSIVGRVKDACFPQPRLDFYALVQARKRKDSPHGPPGGRLKAGEGVSVNDAVIIEGREYAPKMMSGWFDKKEKRLSPYY